MEIEKDDIKKFFESLIVTYIVIFIKNFNNIIFNFIYLCVCSYSKLLFHSYYHFAKTKLPKNLLHISVFTLRVRPVSTFFFFP